MLYHEFSQINGNLILLITDNNKDGDLDAAKHIRVYR